MDERSDIYSLGATLYHLVTGIKPGRDFEQIVPIDQCGTELSEGFVHILQKMMELRPEDRYQCNLSECHMPLFDHLERMLENGLPGGKFPPGYGKDAGTENC